MSAKRLSGIAPASLRIAVLGWGSLLRRPGQLAIRGDWHNDGPCLPIEFARISHGKHLTLVIFPRRRLVQTYWAHSQCPTLDPAIKNLAMREGTPDRNIGFLHRDGSQSTRFPRYVPRLRTWLTTHGLDAVVWTDLPSNFEKETKQRFSNSAALDYLRLADPPVRATATDYVRIAPAQTRTQLRPRLEQELGINPS